MTYPTKRLLREAIYRVRYFQGDEKPESRLVGEPPAPPPPPPPPKKFSVSSMVKIERWIDDFHQRRQKKALERQLKRQKEALVRESVAGIRRKNKATVGVVTLTDKLFLPGAPSSSVLYIEVTAAVEK